MVSQSHTVRSYFALKESLRLGADEYLKVRRSAGWFARFFSFSGRDGIARANNLQLLIQPCDPETETGQVKLFAITRALFKTTSTHLANHVALEMTRGAFLDPNSNQSLTVFFQEDVKKEITRSYEDASNGAMGPNYRNPSSQEVASILLAREIRRFRNNPQLALMESDFRQKLDNRNQEFEMDEVLLHLPELIAND